MYAIFLILVFCLGLTIGLLIGESITVRRFKKNNILKIRQQYRKYKSTK